MASLPTNNTDTAYTKQVRDLISLFHDEKKHAHTVISDAVSFYAAYPAYTKQRQILVDEYKQTGTENDRQALQSKIKAHDRQFDDERYERADRLNRYIGNLLALTEGDTEVETHTASAKFLGTLLLVADDSTDNFALVHQLLKPLYKAVLALRLSDGLLAKGNIKHSYLGKYLDSGSRFTGNRHWQIRWQQELAYPIVKAALLQDIGLYHPASIVVLQGENQEKDPFRLLQDQERKRMLKLNLQHSLSYLKRGLGIPAIIADDAQARQQKAFIEEKALEFAAETIQDATILKNHVGDIIKIPQIYTSFVLSTKSDYTKKDLPKGYMVIEQLMKNGNLESRIARCFLALVGYFPQGFGVSYIAEDEQGNQREGYEYAVVNRLYPSNPAEPKVRLVTRKLTFISSGKDAVIKRHQNLYFQTNHKKLQRIDKERLQEIMGQLSGGQNDKDAEQLIPQFWNPFDFFAEKKHQSLWTTQR